jgi:hypothetical protein
MKRQMEPDNQEADHPDPAHPVLLREAQLDQVSGGKLPRGYVAVTLTSGAIIIISKATGQQVFP